MKGEVVNLGMPKTSDSTDETVVTYHAVECRDGDFLTELYLGRDGEGAVYTLWNEHYELTGHQRFWHYSIQRSHGRTVDPAKGKW